MAETTAMTEAELEAEVAEALSSLTVKDRPAIYSTDPVAVKIRRDVDYSIKITKVSYVECTMIENGLILRHPNSYFPKSL